MSYCEHNNPDHLCDHPDCVKAMNDQAREDREDFIPCEHWASYPGHECLDCIMEPKLSPCPFCGGKAHFGRNGDSNELFGWISCSSCDCNGPMEASTNRGRHELTRMEHMAKDWNNRFQAAHECAHIRSVKEGPIIYRVCSLNNVQCAIQQPCGRRT